MLLKIIASFYYRIAPEVGEKLGYFFALMYSSFIFSMPILLLPIEIGIDPMPYFTATNSGLFYYRGKPVPLEALLWVGGIMLVMSFFFPFRKVRAKSFYIRKNKWKWGIFQWVLILWLETLLPILIAPLCFGTRLKGLNDLAAQDSMTLIQTPAKDSSFVGKAR